MSVEALTPEDCTYSVVLTGADPAAKESNRQRMRPAISYATSPQQHSIFPSLPTHHGKRPGKRDGEKEAII